MSLGLDLWVVMSISHSVQDYFEDLTDVTLADEDSNLIPTDDVNRAILGNVATQVMPHGAKLKPMLVTNSRSANCWPHLQLIQVVPSGGHIGNQFK